MARIFNIYFPFDGKIHNAVVSLRVTPFYQEYLLSNLKSELLELLPGTKILSTSPEHFVFQGFKSEQSEELMTAIISSISTHLHEKKIN